MKIKVRLLGTLSKNMHSYNHANGIDLEVVDGTTFRDLIKVIDLPNNGAYAFTAAGKFKQPDDVLIEEEVNIFRPIAGG